MNNLETTWHPYIPFKKHRQEKLIINKVIKNKPRTFSTFDSDYFSRNNTF